MKNIPSLDYADALRIALAAVEAATQIGIPVTTVVMDATGIESVRLRMDGGSIASQQIAGKKALAALTTRQPTDIWVEKAADNPASAYSASSFPAYCAIPGGFPISVDGQVVGAIGVSGGSYEQDVAIASEALKAI